MSKKLTEKRLLNIALFYLSRYEASEKKLRAVLSRRVLKMKSRGEEVPEEVSGWIEHVIEKTKNYSYINDERYAENKVRSMVEQGKSERYMCLKLQEAGIDSQTVHRLLEEIDSTEEERALCYARKKKLGIFRPMEQRDNFRQKDMATMARAGFSYDVVLSVLDEEK